MKINVKELILFGVLGGLISVSQIALSFIPNVETVSLFIILFSLIYKKKAMYIVFVFVIVMGLIYGFGVWWFGYIILWPFLCVMTYKLENVISGKYLILSLYSGTFGLLFGFFYAIPYGIFGGINAGIAYWVSGIPFDIIHGIGNYFIMLFLGEKIFRVVKNLNIKYFNMM